MSGSFARATAVSKHAASPSTQSVRAVAQEAVAERTPAAEKPERDFAREGVRALWRIPANPPDDSEGARSSFGSGGKLPLQCKLMVGSTTDPLEAEADHVAEHVLAEQPVSVSGAGAGSAGVVRRCACGASGQTCEACGNEKNKTILRRATGDVAPVEAPSIVHDVIRSSGRPLDDGLRRDMEDGFGFDFSRVRVHSEGAADAAARAIGAHAFTTGHNIVFANGQYAPSEPSGRRLIAHELAHVMQQGGSAEATALIRRKPAKVAQYDLAGDAASRLRGVSSSIQLLALQRAAGNRAVTSMIQRAPNPSIDPLTVLTGESDIYAAPISDRPVEQMSKSEVDDEINRLERWIGKQNQSTPDVVQRENRLADLRQRHTAFGAKAKPRRATPVIAVRPRCLTQSLDITQMTRDEMAAELDSIVRFLRLGPSKSDIAKVTHFKHALEQALESQREQENEEVRKRDIALALQPITTGNTYEDFRKVLTVIASIASDPNNTAQAALHLPNGMTVPVSNDEAITLKTQAAQMIKKYGAQSESLAEDTYQAFEERRQKGKEHPIVHGLVKWAADVDDLDELEMFGKKEQARSMQAEIKRLANSGKLIPAFNVSQGLENLAEGYARQVGEWEAALMNSAGRWVLGLTILKEGLTLLATAGAGSLISSARAARGISALRATAEVAGATTFAGAGGAVGSYAASEKLTGGEVTLEGAVKVGRVGGGTGLAIGAAPGAVAAAKEAFGVGKAATTLGNVVRSVGAEVVGNTPVNVAAAKFKGESMKDAAISTVTSSTISGAGAQAVATIAKGSKVASTVGGVVVGGTRAGAGALVTGEDAGDAFWFGAFGGALGPHLEESNKNYLEGRSGGSSTEGAPKPPTTDERFDFGPKAATTGTTGGAPTSSATSVTSQSSAPALTGSRRTSFGGPNEPPLPADVDIEGAVERGLSEHDADRQPYGEAPRPELSEVESAAAGASANVPQTSGSETTHRMDAAEPAVTGEVPAGAEPAAPAIAEPGALANAPEHAGSQMVPLRSAYAPSGEEPIGGGTSRARRFYAKDPQRRAGARQPPRAKTKSTKAEAKTPPAAPRRTPGLPTPHEDAILREYTAGLAELRTRRQNLETLQNTRGKIDPNWIPEAEGKITAANRKLERIEEQARNSTDEATKELGQHLSPLVDERKALMEQGTVATAAGVRVNSDVVDKAPANLRGMDFDDINKAIGRSPDVIDPPRGRTKPGEQATSHGRLEWRFSDGSRLVIDDPRQLGGRAASADLPHAELHGPKGERLDQQGITVPERSISAHMTITDHKGTLESYFAKARKQPTSE